MSAKSKIYASFDDAVRDIPDGATVGFGGFAVVGMPINLYEAVAKQGAKNLTCVSNSTRGGATLPANGPDMGQMIANGQVKKVICAFTAPTRASQRLVLTEYVEKGLIEAELTPQGTLAERMRAAGAGIPAFYTPAAVGTELAEGRETRFFNGREYLLEHALPLDYACIRAYQADAAGNLRFRRSQRNFNPIMAMAARVTIVEVEEDILPVGAIDPDDVHTSGIFVHRLVKIPPAPAARIRSAKVPCGVSSASIRPFSTYSVSTSRCEARVGAVKAQITFLTCPFLMIWLISGASAGKVAPPRVEFDTQVRFFAPCRATAL